MSPGEGNNYGVGMSADAWSLDILETDRRQKSRAMKTFGGIGQ